MLPDSPEYASSEKRAKNPHIGAPHGEYPPPPPAYMEVDNRPARGPLADASFPRQESRSRSPYMPPPGPPDDREFKSAAYGPGPSADGPWAKDASMPYEGRGSYDAPRGMHQSYAGYPAAGPPPSQPYSGYASPYAAPSQPHGPYASQPGMSYASGGYAASSGYSSNEQVYAGASRFASPSMGRMSPGMAPWGIRGALFSRADMQSSYAPMRGPRGGGGLFSGALMNLSQSPAQGVRSLLDPPPPSFRRSARPDLPYEPFEPASITSLDRDLDGGFPMAAPPSRAVPHPFATHDIFEDDWCRFVQDVRAAAAISSEMAAPTGRRIGLVGTLVSLGVEQATKSKSSDAVSQLIDQWNMHFFHPRQMTVVLAKGSKAYNGSGSASPPDIMSVDEDKHANGKWRLVIAYRPESGY
ncbi:uncharacterized protein C8Q71DRAFT_859078 [Rhodofomes roseus]|uniref:Uncharacterized protein n=1 Tax=Rhodofomes roseus TaxID=34475 RepID=A0ABQ8KD10_9APHY|nr:uncharacterized protein C8Q71DRAFT_859078 [Rhodofomes roseus]KAH9835453.1 hypothetical protein C8Q71DRAFT_859078 [Rhodofomes roseus]